MKIAVESVFKLNPILSKDIRHRGSADMYCTKVCRPIKEATLCIADLTYNNSNVGFEIAVAQGFNKPVIVTRYIPKGKKLNKTDKDLLEEIKKKGIVQYSIVPNPIASDIQAMYRVEYSNERELKEELEAGFKIE